MTSDQKNSGRVAACFAKARQENRLALGIFITAGDPDLKTAQEILLGLPDHGADFVELGMPFSDPMADGPAIQAASLRAIEAGTTLDKVLDLAQTFRQAHPTTPLILMGYYNPIYVYGKGRFLDKAKDVGVDGLLIVDLPMEEDDELCVEAQAEGLAFIRLLTPTSHKDRLAQLLPSATGFLYYVSITGTTGTRQADHASIATASKRIRAIQKQIGKADMPLVVGFGIRTPQQIESFANIDSDIDGVVIGSAVVEEIAKLGKNGKSVAEVLALIKELRAGANRATLNP